LETSWLSKKIVSRSETVKHFTYINVSSAAAIQLFLGHSFPRKILPDLSIPSRIRPSDFHFFGFHKIILHRKPRFQLPPWRTRSLYLCPQSDRVDKLHPQALGSL
jgi:hypothetical protein